MFRKRDKNVENSFQYKPMCGHTLTFGIMYGKTPSLYCSLELYGVHLVFIDLATAI